MSRRIQTLRRRSRTRADRGQSLVELAVILPVALLLLTASIDVGRIIFTYIALEDAAHEGAVFMAHNPASPSNASATTLIRNRVITSSTASEVTQATVATTCSTTQVTVTATGPGLEMLTPAGKQLFGSIVLSSRITATNLKEQCP